MKQHLRRQAFNSLLLRDDLRYSSKWIDIYMPRACFPTNAYRTSDSETFQESRPEVDIERADSRCRCIKIRLTIIVFGV